MQNCASCNRPCRPEPTNHNPLSVWRFPSRTVAPDPWEYPRCVTGWCNRLFLTYWDPSLTRAFTRPVTGTARVVRLNRQWPRLRYVVDMDLSKCFDRLDHELILRSVNRRVSDGSVLRLLKQFLTAGVMDDGALYPTTLGSPQGGVISPLLANIYLDAFDQHMMRQGIRIVRFADDILIFARTRAEAGCFFQLARQFLEGDLKLVVNQQKTHITSVYEGVAYLGFVIRRQVVSIHPKAIRAFKQLIRKLTPRNHGLSVVQLVQWLNPKLRGWVNYYRIANCKGLLRDLTQWLRRRLRMKKLREWKSWKGLHRALRRLRGYRGDFQHISMFRWRNSASPLVNMALPNGWFDELGLYDLTRVQTGSLSQYYEG